MIFKGLEKDLFYEDGQVNIGSVVEYIKLHQPIRKQYQHDFNMYNGDHNILRTQSRPDLANNKLVNNFAKEIVTMASTYFIGKPIQYTGAQIDDLKEAFRKALAPQHDSIIAKYCSIYGVAFELNYIDEGEIKIKAIPPTDAFSIEEQSIKETLLMSVYYYIEDSLNDAEDVYVVYIYTLSGCTIYRVKSLESCTVLESSFIPNITTVINLYPYRNNQELSGDFAQVKTLIDAYNKTLSASINDIEDFTDALLVLVNAQMGDTPERADEAYEKMRRWKTLELNNGGDAKYLTKTMDQSSITTILECLDQNIHKFSMVPCLSDSSFAGVQSGEALKYKLIGLESICLEKEMMFVAGLSYRLKFFADILNLKGKHTGLEDVGFQFTRNLPESVGLEADKVAKLLDIVSLETALEHASFVSDVPAEIERINKERAESSKRSNESFYNFEE